MADSLPGAFVHSRVEELPNRNCFGINYVISSVYSVENNATLYRTEKHCGPKNRPKTGEEMTKNRIWAFFRLVFITSRLKIFGGL